MTSTPTTAAAALYEALRRIADAPQDAELDLGRGDARAIIRNLLAEVEAQQPAEDTPAVPTVGARYEKHAGPNAGRTITITRVWADDDGPAVAYKWDAPHAGGGACPLAVFQRSYRPATGTTAP